MEIGVVGKPNVGKSTMFNALTLLDVPMAPYPFTTLQPNRGVAAVRTPCPHVELGTPCTPGNAKCVDGVRWVPVRLVDVPGLVPGAHEGKGLGHQFLDDLRAADGFLQVVDASGATASDGTPGVPGQHDPAEEIEWLEDEIVHWFAEILGRDFARHVKSVELEGRHSEEFLGERLAGLAISPNALSEALRSAALDRGHPSAWSPADRLRLAREILRAAKPRLIAANKCDRSTPAGLADLAQRIAPVSLTGTFAEGELTLRRAAKAGVISYAPGASSFEPTDPARLSAPQLHALEALRRHLAAWGSTGVQGALERLVCERLRRIVVFPVEDEVRWTDGRGRVLPDALLVPEGTTARGVAYRVHSDLGEGFVRALDGRTHRALAAVHPVASGTVLKILSRR